MEVMRHRAGQVKFLLPWLVKLRNGEMVSYRAHNPKFPVQIGVPHIRDRQTGYAPALGAG